MSAVPFESAAIDGFPSRRAWDAVSVELLGDVLERWSLTVKSSYAGGFAGTVVAVRRADGTPAVLKLGFPHIEAVGEALALEAWPDGCGPAVLDQDAWRWALLLEKVDPGDPMSVVGEVDRDLAPACELLARIWSTPRGDGVEGVPPASVVIGTYLGDARSRLPGQSDRLAALGVLESVTTALREAEVLLGEEVRSQGARGDVLLHGDFNPGNILRSGAAGGGAWVAIDPKPMVGDGAFDLAPLVSQLGSPFSRRDPAAVLELRIREAAEISGCDARRATRWAAVRQALSVTWYLNDDAHDFAETAAAELVVWDEVRRRMC